MSDEPKPDCWDCGGSGRVCPSEPDKCPGCEDCERCGGTGQEPGTEHPYLKQKAAHAGGPITGATNNEEYQKMEA